MVADPKDVHGPVPHSYLNGSSAEGIPFRFEKGNIYIAVQIDDGPETDMIFDSGMPAGGIYLFENPVADSLVPVGKGSRKAKIALPGIVFPEVTLRRTAIRLDCGAAGIIGPDILGSCVVRIDYTRSVIDLYDPGRYDFPDGTVGLPLTFFDRSPFIEVTVELESDGEPENVGKFKERDRLTALCCLDLGSAGGLHLYSSDRRKLPPPGEFADAYLGTGVDGPIYGKKGRIALLRVGSLELADVECAFSDQKAYPGHEDLVFGNIGNMVLQRFIMTIDYRSRRVFFRPRPSPGS